MTRVIYMDLNRCIFCRACEVACEKEHNGISNMFVQLVEERYAVPMNCRHCETSPCTLVCPTQAVHREGSDAVVIDSMICIGCKLCNLACPFGMIWPDPFNKIARKCDLCIHRRAAGLDPACVTTCSARALWFGEVDEILAEAPKKSGVTIIHRAGGETGTILTLPKNGKNMVLRKGETE